uniref:MATE family efflux transporter n=1 Tax=uncultured Bacillota bacterium TaxID=344338 RepID=A0A650EMP1_9FIRM|nr:MATE family efflux transporter [uncultured Firmicutes bacterium]
MTNNMTAGNPAKLILRFSIPLLIGNLFQQLYNMVDTLIVGRTLGYQALAAVGVTGGLSFLILGFVQGFTSGFTIPVAQRFGADDFEEMRSEVGMSVLLSVIITAILTVGSVLLTRPALELMQTPDDIIDGAYTYIVIIFGGMVTITFYNLLSNILRALGDSKTPLIFLIVASLLNIVLDLIFIRGVGMNVEGAALATVLSQMVSGILCLVVIVKKFPILHLKRRNFRFTWQRARRHLALGMPMAFQFSITAVGVLILQAVLNGFGSETIAGYTAASKVEQLSVQPLLSIGMAMATYSAQNFGAGKLDRVRAGAWAGTAISAGFALFGAAIILFLGRHISALFMENPTEKILDSSQIYLNTISAFYIPLAMIFVFRNILQGVGKGLVPLMAGVSELVLRAVVAVVISPFLGYQGVCLAGPAAWVGAAIPLILAYWWHSKRLLKEKTIAV